MKLSVCGAKVVRGSAVAFPSLERREMWGVRMELRAGDRADARESGFSPVLLLGSFRRDVADRLCDKLNRIKNGTYDILAGKLVRMSEGNDPKDSFPEKTLLDLNPPEWANEALAEYERAVLLAKDRGRVTMAMLQRELASGEGEEAKCISFRGAFEIIQQLESRGVIDHNHNYIAAAAAEGAMR